jgi:hypothetical protein
MYGMGAVNATGYQPPLGGWLGSAMSGTDGNGPPLGASDLESIVSDEQSAELLFAMGGPTDDQENSSTFVLGMLGTLLDVLDTNRQTSGATVNSAPPDDSHNGSWTPPVQGPTGGSGESQGSGGSGDGSSGDGGGLGGSGLGTSGGGGHTLFDLLYG